MRGHHSAGMGGPMQSGDSAESGLRSESEARIWPKFKFKAERQYYGIQP